MAGITRLINKPVVQRGKVECGLGVVWPVRECQLVVRGRLHDSAHVLQRQPQPVVCRCVLRVPDPEGDHQHARGSVHRSGESRGEACHGRRGGRAGSAGIIEATHPRSTRMRVKACAASSS